MCDKCTVLSKRMSHVRSLQRTCFGSRGPQVRILPPRLDRNNENPVLIDGVFICVKLIQLLAQISIVAQRLEVQTPLVAQTFRKKSKIT